MMSRNISHLFFASVIVALLGPSSASADDDAGARSVFAIGAGNRPLAMGGAYAAIDDGDATAVSAGKRNDQS